MHIVIHNPIAETAFELEVGESVLIDNTHEHINQGQQYGCWNFYSSSIPWTNHETNLKKLQ